MGERLVFDQSMVREYYYPGALNADHHTQTLRALHIAAGSPGSIVLMPEFDGVDEYIEDQTAVFNDVGLEMPRTVIVSGDSYVFDEDIMTNLNFVEDALPKDEKLKVVSFARTPDQDKWVRELQNRGLDIDQHDPLRVYYEEPLHPSHRGGWGRHVSNPDFVPFPEKYDLPYPASWVGTGLPELIQAYRNVVAETGSPNVFFKPIYTSGGDAMGLVRSEKQLRTFYQELKADGLLDSYVDDEGNSIETAVEMQADVGESLDFYSVQYNDGEVVTPGGSTEQLIDFNGHWMGNTLNSQFKVEAQEEAADIGARAIAALKEELGDEFIGPGGIDIADSKNGMTILENNGARLTAVHPVIAAAENLGVEDKPLSLIKWNLENIDSSRVTLGKIWEFFKGSGLAFNSGDKVGVFPIVWTEGEFTLMYVGNTDSELVDLISRVDEVINREQLNISVIDPVANRPLVAA